jgi:hypothetical protein
MKNPWKCPQCGNETTDYPAICRRDNKTEICSACGTAQGLADFFKISEAKAREVADHIKECQERGLSWKVETGQ